MQLSQLLGGAREVTPANMAEALQQAVDIEIATLPTYLSTYYTVNRVPDQGAIQDTLRPKLEAAGHSAEDAKTLALELSAEIMVTANQAGAQIISVAIEEMLHMALSSNVHQSLFGPPALVGRSPQDWPAHLPGSVDPFPINRKRLSLAAVETFIDIESPTPPAPVTGDEDPGTIPLLTIGEFYRLIEEALKTWYPSPEQYDTSRPQLVPGKRYYAQNNINTNHYDKQHKPQFANADDSGDLIGVGNLETALDALEEIVRQGEGADSCFDDPAQEELTHYAKFKALHTELAGLQARFRHALADPDFDALSLFVYPVADNVVTADYPAALQTLSNLTNAVYTYLFVMVEDCYRHGGNRQFEVFMMGIHKTMMWILGSLCEGHMAVAKYVGKDGNPYNAAPTFEHWSFSAATSPKQQLIELHAIAAAHNSGLEIVGGRIRDLPDVPLQPYQALDPNKAILA